MLDRIATAFNRFGATRAVAFDISKAFDRVWHSGLLHKVSWNFRRGLWPSSFLSNRRLWVVLEGSHRKNIQLVLEFLNGLFLVLHFSCYTLMTFLMMLSVILLFILMILLSTLNVRHLICGNNWNQLLNLNLMCETLWTGVESALFISVLEKLN